MKGSCSSISEILERYFDQEVTSEERILVEGHLADCQTCQAALAAMEGLRDLIRSPVEEADQKESFPWVWQKIEREIQLEERPVWRETIRRWLDVTPIFRKRVWVPAAAVVTAIFLAFAPFFFKKLPSSPDSSVVEYVECQNYNVMVYESEKENVTVIWLFEGPQMEGLSTS